MPIDRVQKLINAIDNNKTEFTFSPIITEKLRKLVNIPEPEKLVDELKQTKIELKQQTKNEFEQMNDELKQIKEENKQMNDELKQIEDDIQEQLKGNHILLNSFDELKQQIKDMQELLNSFIKHSNTKNDIKDNN